jgi:glutamate N-acetyltransferase / amino-acid N-acetyltransferase
MTRGNDMNDRSHEVDVSSGAITRVAGFTASGVACGLKASGDRDLALVVCDVPASAAGVFTRNAFRAAPVLIDERLLEHNAQGMRAVIMNAGNANACTGEQGMWDAQQMIGLTEAEVGLPAGSVLVMSTGVIGHPLPMERVREGIREAASTLSLQGGHDCAEAIMTTDLVTKEAYVSLPLPGIGTISIGGIAKGSGMIAPDLGPSSGMAGIDSSSHATMLALVVTDARMAPETLQYALEEAVNISFNRITVDGDTSTNDTVLALASGLSGDSAVELGTPDYAIFLDGLTNICQSLAIQIARDGEGATKLVEIHVKGAYDDAQAVMAAKTIANSPLVKTALFGSDPNWGRILAALGRSGVHVNPVRVALWIGDTQLVANGEPIPFDPKVVSAYLSGVNVTIEVDMGLSSGQARVWTCDMSYRYVEINAEYHT